MKFSESYSNAEDYNTYSAEISEELKNEIGENQITINLSELNEGTYEAKLEKIGTALGQNSQGGGNQGFTPGGKPHR